MTVLLEESSIIIEHRPAGDGNRPIRATIVNVEEDHVIACLEGAAEFRPGDEVNVGYTDPGTRRFVKASGRVVTLLGLQPKPIYQILITGAFQFAERRAFPRVKFEHLEIQVRLGTDRECRLRDVGRGGLGILSRSEFSINSTIPLGVEYLGHRCSGVGRVRHIQQADDDLMLYGIEVDVHETAFRNWLSRACTFISERQRTVRNLLEDSDLRELFERELTYPDRESNNGLDTQSAMPMWLNVLVPARHLMLSPIAGSILDEDGNLLHERGTILGPDDLKSLRGRNVVLAADWFRTLDDEIADSLHLSSRERRTFKRSPWRARGQCRVLDKDDSRSFSITTVDLSPGGMGFESQSYISVDTVLEIEIELGGTLHRARGRAVSCRVVDERQNPIVYRVGVRFTESILECNTSYINRA